MEDNKVISIELRGLDPVPEEEQHGDPRGLFGLWWGGQFGYISVVIGALLILIGLSLVAALTAILVGAFLGAIFVGFAGILGPRTHTATIVNTRAVFGIMGNIPAEVFNLITIVGWAVVNSVLAALALITLFDEAGWEGDLAKVVAVAIVIVAQAGVALVGINVVEKSEKVFAIVSTILLFAVVGFLLDDIKWGFDGDGLTGKAAVGTWLLGVAIVFSGPMSWVNCASDYTRYYPPGTSLKKIALWSGGAMFAATVLSFGIGALLATVVDMSNPVANLPDVLPGWFLIPFLFVVIWSAVANNVLNVYSAGLAFLALHIDVKRWLSVTFIGLVTAGFAYYAIFVSNFSTTFTNFLLLQLLWLAPWIVLELLDYVARRGDYDVEALHTWRAGRYWYRDGWNWVPLGIFAVAILASLPFANHPSFHTDLATDTLGGADLSPLVGMLVAAALYWPYAKSRVRQHNPPGDVAPPLAPPAAPHEAA